jgi:hypothetical protein
MGVCGLPPGPGGHRTRCYTSGRAEFESGGATIAEVLRQAWNRLAHKQWLIFYPIALSVISTMAFLAVYSAAGGPIRWSTFFASNFERWQFVREEFFSGFSFTPALAVAVFAGLAVCVLSAMLRAPLFRAIAGPGYPLAPRGWEEVGRLSLFYAFLYLVVWVLPLAAPTGTILDQVIAVATLVIALLLVYTDYVIVFEGLAFVPAMRRSARLLARRWPPVLLIFVILQLVDIGLYRLYGLYYDGENGFFVLIPVTEILVQSFLSLVVDLILIFLYEHVRRTSPS